MEGFFGGGELYLCATNNREFKELIEKVQDQAEELEKTINKLYAFCFKIVSVDDLNSD